MAQAWRWNCELPSWSEISQAVSELVEEVLGAFPAGAGRFPETELRKTTEGYVLLAALPGMTREEVKVWVEARGVVIEGERRTIGGADWPEAAELVQRERPSGRFRRMVALPEPVDPARAKARLRDGVLVVDLPRLGATEPRQVEIVVEEGE